MSGLTVKTFLPSAADLVSHRPQVWVLPDKVSLRAQENVEGFIQALQQDYYETYQRIPEEYFDIPKSIPEAGKHRKPKAGWTNIVFASRPSSGGAILKLSAQDAVLLQ